MIPGIYSEISGNIEITNHISIDDLVAVYPMVYGPAAAGHAWENKYVSITDSHYVGYSSVAQCADPDQVFNGGKYFFYINIAFSRVID